MVARALHRQRFVDRWALWQGTDLVRVGLAIERASGVSIYRIYGQDSPVARRRDPRRARREQRPAASQAPEQAEPAARMTHCSH